MKYLFLFFVLIPFIGAIDQSPIASFTCQLCSVGNALANYFLPDGRTCTDLDAAFIALGKNGCFGLQNITSQNLTLPQPPMKLGAPGNEIIDPFLTEMEKWLIVGLTFAGVVMILIIVAAVVIVWCVLRRNSAEDIANLRADAAASEGPMSKNHVYYYS